MMKPESWNNVLAVNLDVFFTVASGAANVISQRAVES